MLNEAELALLLRQSNWTGDSERTKQAAFILEGYRVISRASTPVDVPAGVVWTPPLGAPPVPSATVSASPPPAPKKK